MNDIKDIEEISVSKKKDIGITHQIITNNEILLNRIKKIYEKGSLNELDDPKIVKFVKGLLKNDKNESLRYNSKDDFENRSKFLRKSLHCQPR